MFVDDNSIDNIQQLYTEFKKYLKLQKRYTQLEIAEKLTLLLSKLLLILVVVILGMMALFYLSLTVAYLLAPLVGGLKDSFAIICGVQILLIVLVIILRKSIIVNPLTKFITGMFKENDKNDKK